MNLTDQSILLTGGSRGIGRAMLDQLLDRGCRVMAVARDVSDLEGHEAARDGRLIPLAADLAEPGAAEHIADRVWARLPDVSVLINNAAVMTYTRYPGTGDDHADAIAREIAINLTAPLQLSVAMLPILASRPRAAICNVTSGLAHAPIANAAVYCATKAGLAQFSRVLRYQCEDAGLGIEVSEAVMTLVDTTLSMGDPARKARPEAAAAEVLVGIEAGRPQIWVERTRLLRRIMRLSPALGFRVMRRMTPA